MFSDPPAELQRVLDAARSQLGAFADLRYAETIGSTNDVALQLAANGAPEGTSVLAEQQTSGRGRRGRVWSSPPGAGLYLSTVLRGAALTVDPGVVTLGAGVAAADAVLAATGLPVALKWPNDLVIGDAWKKLGGILCEAHGADAIVIGIGINITSAAHPPDVAMRATAIDTELGRPTDRSTLIVECLTQLRALAETLRSPERLSLLDRWRARAADGWHAAHVRWQDQGVDDDGVARTLEVRGIARDVDADGALIVERDGRRERVIAGEVVWERRQ